MQTKQQDIDLEKDSLPRLFIKYSVPAVTGMLVLTAHILLDGIFVGRGIGSLALAAVNICIPAYSIIMSLGLLIGIGGATLVSIKHGEGKSLEANKYFSQSMIILLILSLVITILSQLFLDQTASWFGADRILMPLVKDYIGIIFLFSGFFIFTEALAAFVRNDGNPQCAMFSMVIGAVVNCILNYLFIFIFAWGLKGAALATGIAQVLSVLVVLIHFFQKKGQLRWCKTRLKWDDLKRINKNGMTNFIAEVSMAITIIVFNQVLMELVGDRGVSAYSVINYLATIFFALFMGIGQAIQPIISHNYGASRFDRVNDTYLLARRVSLLIGILVLAGTIMAADSLVALFIPADKELLSMTVHGIYLYYPAFIFMGVNICSTTYLQAVEKARNSTILSLLRGCVLVILGLIIFPYIFGMDLDGAWLSVPFAELISLIIAAFMIAELRNELFNSKEPVKLSL